MGGLCCCADAESIRVFVILDRRCFGISKVQHQLNDEINDKEIRLIGEGGEQMGIVSGEEALRIAEEHGLDLVKISPQATPPVCKLMNYGKYKFEQSKREKEARKNQHVVEIKEIRMSPGIDVGDFNTKLKNAQKFLSDGNRVKVSVRFRGDGAHRHRPRSSQQVCRPVYRSGDPRQGGQAGGTEHVHLPVSQGRQVTAFSQSIILEGVILCLN